MPKKETRMEGFTLYQGSIELLRMLSDEQAGKSIKAAAAYFLEGEKEDQKGDPMVGLVSTLLCCDVDRAVERYRDACERNRANRRGRQSAAAETGEGAENAEPA